jgi:hypothetical protein
MTNQRTTGSLKVIAGQHALIEGDAYIKPTLLRGALERLEDVKVFFKNPVPDILRKYRVDYVIFTPGRTLGGNDILHGNVDLGVLENATYL